MSRTSENSELRKLHPFRTSVTLTLSLTRVNLEPRKRRFNLLSIDIRMVFSVI